MPDFYAVVQFSINQSIYFVNEQAGMVSVCVELLTGRLDRQVNLDLVPSNGTADTRDFSSSVLVYMFPSGSVSDCNDVSITRDGVVEQRESFVVELRDNTGDRAVEIVQDSATIFIDDSLEDCKL